ncbi:hypothetical protein GCM10010348_63220 [Streptomyces anthocyanicus]|nr:hypothetical protein GCM10010391_70080 [Streptomyces anthocyanicus]GHC28414.1 hypothetical protein GCM10010348_63220 [Streptomyces anthocyanicus]
MPVQATPAAPCSPPLPASLTTLAFRAPFVPKESIPMAETTVRRRVRHLSRTSDSDRKNAAAALQRSLDRRDNGGATGH